MTDNLDSRKLTLQEVRDMKLKELHEISEDIYRMMNDPLVCNPDHKSLKEKRIEHYEKWVEITNINSIIWKIQNFLNRGV